MPTHGPGSAKVWRPCTPALAAGLTLITWLRKEVWLSRGFCLKIAFLRPNVKT